MTEVVSSLETPARPQRDPRALADQIERYGFSFNVIHSDIGQDFRDAAYLIREQLIELEQLRALQDRTPVSEEVVERATKAIWDANDPTSGDPIGVLLHAYNPFIAGDTFDEGIEQAKDIARSAARAAIAALPSPGDCCRTIIEKAAEIAARPYEPAEAVSLIGRPRKYESPGQFERRYKAAAVRALSNQDDSNGRSGQ